MLCKDEKINIKIGNLEINSKNSVLLDLSSPSNIIANLDYKKGTLLYEYINNRVPLLDFENNDLIEGFLKDLINKFNTNSDVIEYDYYEDTIKFISTILIPKLKNDNYLENINILLEDYLSNCMSKTFIIIYNSNQISLERFFNNDNIYFFDIGIVEDIANYNIIFSDDIYNVDINILVEELYNEWPIPIDKEIIIRYITLYFKVFKNFKNIICLTENEYIFFKILNKKYNLSLNIKTSITLSNPVQAFLTNF